MTTIERSNANELDHHEYLLGLKTCFPDWGEQAMFDWCFRRELAGLLPDLLMARDEASGSMLAGSAVTYRTVSASSGERFLAAIMTGSWTLPAARGQGLFATMIEESKHAAAAKGAHLLLAFVAEQNASKRRLEAAGAIMHPTAYCRRLVAEEPLRMTGSEPLEIPISDVDVFARSRGTRFVYSAPEWRAQFIDRPSANAVTCLQSREGAWSAIVEEAGELDRVHAIAAADDATTDKALHVLADRASRRNRRLFIFTTVDAREAALASAGFEILRGYLAILAIGSRSSPSDWNLENGDRM